MICVYIITNTINNKQYIGYTTKGLSHRWNMHIKNAYVNNVQTYLYNAMRCYGLINFSIKVLEECDNYNDAINGEKFYIEKYDTFNTGYNMTLGGDGGLTTRHWTIEQHQEYSQKRSIMNKKENNGRWSGYSDDQLVLFGVDMVKIYGICGHSRWRQYAKQHSLPITFSKNRFDGSFTKFKQIVQLKCDELNIPYQLCYIKTQEHKDKLSKSSPRLKWITNGIINQKLYPGNEIPSNWWLGRTIKRKGKI